MTASKPDPFPIEDCLFGAVTVFGRRYASDLLVLPDGSVQDGWWRRKGHELHLEDLTRLLSPRPGLLVVGTGIYGRMRPSDDLREGLEAMGVEMTAAPTCEAVQRFNRSWKPGAGIAGCFHLTC